MSVCQHNHLELATEGPCKGHLCDNCKICQSGRCCRRDNPDYKLPELGEWDGPIYGELGKFARDSDTVECHCCGQSFRALISHIWRRHNLTANEYKAIFGLKVSVGLQGSATRSRMVETSSTPKRVAILLSNRPVLTSEQRSAMRQVRALRLEQVQDPHWQEMQLVRQSSGRAKAHATIRTRLLDEDYRRWYRANLIEANRRIVQQRTGHRNIVFAFEVAKMLGLTSALIIRQAQYKQSLLNCVETGYAKGPFKWAFRDEDVLRWDHDVVIRPNDSRTGVKRARKYGVVGSYFSITEVACQLGISKQRVHQLTQNGKIKHVDTPSGPLISQEAIDEFRALRLGKEVSMSLLGIG